MTAHMMQEERSSAMRASVVRSSRRHQSEETKCLLGPGQGDTGGGRSPYQEEHSVAAPQALADLLDEVHLHQVTRARPAGATIPTCFLMLWLSNQHAMSRDLSEKNRGRTISSCRPVWHC